MLGDGAMIKMAQSKVFLSGLGGLGIEIGKIQYPNKILMLQLKLLVMSYLPSLMSF